MILKFRLFVCFLFDPHWNLPRAKFLMLQETYLDQKGDESEREWERLRERWRERWQYPKSESVWDSGRKRERERERERERDFRWNKQKNHFENSFCEMVAMCSTSNAISHTFSSLSLILLHTHTQTHHAHKHALLVFHAPFRILVCFILF